MSITTKDLVQLATDLADGAMETAWRSSASRAYYGAYHQAQGVAHLCPDNANLAMGSHERLTQRFDLHGSKGAKSISIVLQAMKRVRHLADYDLDQTFPKVFAEQQLAQYSALNDRLVAFENLHKQKTA